MSPHGPKNSIFLTALAAACLALCLLPETASLQTDGPRRVTHTPEHATSLNPTISGDGLRVVFETTADLASQNSPPQFRTFAADVSSDPPSFARVADSRAPAPAVSQDGSRVAFSSADDLTGANPDRNPEIFLSEHGALRQLTNTSPSDQTARPRDGSFRPSISDDGRLVAFSSNRDLTGANADGNLEIFLLDLRTNTFAQLTDTAAPSANTDAKLCGDGSRLAFIRESPADAGAGDAAPRRDLILHERNSGLSRAVIENYAGLALTPGRAVSDDGLRVAFAAEDSRGASQVFLFDGRNDTIRQLTRLGTRQSDVPLHPSISGDGSRVSFATRRGVISGANPDSSVELYLYDLPTARLSRLTDAPREATAEVVSSLDDAGLSIAFNFPRVLAGPPASADFSDASEIFLARPPARTPHSTDLEIIHAAAHGRDPSPDKFFAPGQIALARGTNLSLVSRQSARLPGGDFPRTLSNVTVTVNGRAARVFYVSPAQVNFQFPDETGTGAAEVVVRNHDGYESRAAVQVSSAAPGVFTERGDGRGAAVALDAATQLRAPLDPVDHAGSLRTLVLFATGVAHARAVSVTLGGRDTLVERIVRSPDLPGLDEIHVRLRHSLAGAGAVRCVVTADGRESNAAIVEFVGSRRPARVTLAPSRAALGVGRTLRLAAKVFDADGGEVEGAAVTFTSSDAGVATVDGNGIARAVGEGATTIRATVATATGEASATTELRVHSLTLVINEALIDPPDGPAGDANRDGTRSASQDEFVEIVNATGGDIDLGGYRIEARNSSGASVVRHLFAHGSVLAPGTAAVVFGGASSAFNPNDTAFGGALILTASTGALSLPNGGGEVSLLSPAGEIVEQLTYGGGTQLEGDRDQSLTRAPDVTGDFLNHLAASPGSPRAFSPGTRAGGTPFHTSAPVAHVEISPTTATVQIGGPQQFTARAFDATGRELSGVIFRWESSRANVAGIDQSGLATARTVGTTQIVAHARGVASQHSALNVVPPPPRVVRVEVSPAVAAVNRGGAHGFAARAFDREGRIVADADFVWSSSDANVAAVNDEGLARGVGVGAATITAATDDGAGGIVAATARLEVRVPLVLSELLADVPPDPAGTAAIEGDANRDGLRGSDDEFVELLNASGSPLDLSGLRLADSTSTRFTFPAGAWLAPSQAAIVFGGGDPPVGDPAFGGALVFTAASLGLNDAGDTLTLKLPAGGSQQVVLTQTYGSVGGPAAPRDQSLARSPDASVGSAAGDLIPHRAAPNSAGRSYSPGTRSDGTPFGSPRLTRLEISPAEASVDLGAAHTFAARAFASSDGSEVEITKVSFAWEVSDESKAEAAPAQGTRTVATGRASGTLKVRASAGGLHAEATLTVRPPPPVLTRIEVTPRAASVVAGRTQQFAARAFDQFGAEMPGVALGWRSGDASVATINPAGLAAAHAPGAAEITASAGTLTSPPATLTVTPPPRRVTRVELTPAKSSINRGAALQFSARAFDAAGVHVADARFDWTSSDAAIAAVDAQGLARGVGAGRVTLHASTADGVGGAISTSASLEVRLPLVLNEFLADVPQDDAATAAVEGDANRDGLRQSGGDEFVEFLNASGAPVDLSGLRLSDSTSVRFTFPAGATLAAGRAAVVFGGGSPTADDPAFGGAHVFRTGALSLNDGGDTLSLKLPLGATEFVVFTQSYGTAGGTHAPSDQSLTRSPDASAATLTGGDFVPHLLARDSAGRRFSPGTRADGTPFESPPLTRIEISPADSALDIGASQAFTARAYSNAGGAEVEVRNVSFAWESTDAAKAALAHATGAGTSATARAHGSLAVRARAGGLEAEARLAVNPPPPVLTRIEVSPATASILVGGRQQFGASVFDQFDRPMPGITFAWSSSDPSVAAVDTAGSATGLKPGSVEIRASSNGLTSSPVTLNVHAPPPRVTRIEVSPTSASINRGGEQRFSARAFGPEGVEVTSVPLTWSSSDAAVATIDAAGLARGVGAGPVTLRVSAPDGAGGTTTAEAALEVRVPLVLTELLADVPPDNASTPAVEGDANRDGVRNSGDDEFVELFNSSDAPVDLSGLRVSDSTGVRFTFPAGTALAARRAALIYGGGRLPSSDPAFGGALLFTANALSLNDTGDVVTLKLAVGGNDFAVLSQPYGTAGGPAAPADQSLALTPDTSADTSSPTLIPHLSASHAAGRRFSPGTRTDGTPFGSPPLTRIQIMPAAASLDIGGAQTFSARAYANAGGGEVEIQNVSFAWESGDAIKAALTRQAGADATADALSAGVAAVGASAGGLRAEAVLTVRPPPPVLTRIEVTPEAATIFTGAAQQFAARAFDQNGEEMSGVAFEWAAGDASIATVDAAGLANGVRPGSTNIRASSGNVTSEPAALTVVAPPPLIARLELTPATAAINRGGSRQFSVRAFGPDGREVSDPQPVWDSSDDKVAAVDQAGLARGVGAGAVTINVSAPDGSGGAVRASAALEVRVPLVLTELLADVPPDNATTPAVEGDANRDGLRSSGGDEFVELLNVSDAPVDLSGVRLSDSTGLRFTFAQGATLEAGRSLVIFGGGSPPARDPAFGGSLILTAGALSLNDGGDTISLKLPVGSGEFVVLTQSYGSAGGPAAPADQSLTRTPDAPAGPGETNDLVPHRNAPDAAGRNFSPGTRADGTPFGSPPVTRIEISPADASLDIGGAQTYTARAFADSGGVQTEITNTSFVWDASDAAKVSLAPTTGAQTTASALSAGSLTLRARAGGREAAAALTVSPPPPVLTRVEVSPPSATLVVGESRRFTARAFDQYGAPFPVNSFTFESGEPATVTILSQAFADGGTEAAATVTANAAGEAQLTATATDGERSVTSQPALVKVVPPPPVLSRISVTPASATVGVGATQQFTARGFDQNDQEVTGLTFEWISSDPALAAVDADGRATGLNPGAVEIRASAGGVLSPPAPLTVEAPPVPTAGQVIINEALVAFSTSSTQARADFVELYNTTDRTLDISGLAVSFRAGGTSNNVRTITLPGAVGSDTLRIRPRTYFLIINGAETFGAAIQTQGGRPDGFDASMTATDFNSTTGTTTPVTCVAPVKCFELNNTTGAIKIEIGGVKLDGLTYKGGGDPAAHFLTFGEGPLLTFAGGTTNDLIRSPNAADTDNNSADFKRNGTALTASPKADNPTLP